jgi:hypothetical protein
MGKGEPMKSKLKPLRLTVFILAFVWWAGFAGPSAHASMSPEEVLKKADEARGRAEGLEWEIFVESIEKGRRQDRTLRVTARSYNSLAEFLAPANMKGQKLLMLDRTMWFAKPGLSKAVPISPRQRLLGKAANGDIAATNYSGDYKVAHAGDGVLDKEACYIFDLTAADRKATYDRIRYWISKERLVGVRAEFYTVSGKMFKAASFEYENSITVHGRPREFVSKMIIADAILKDEVTTLYYRKPLTRSVPDSTFNLNLLLR